MAEPRIHALSALLGGFGFVGSLAIVLLLCLASLRGRVRAPAIASALVYLLLVTLVPQAERILPMVGPPLGIAVGMLSLFVVCVLRDAVQRWRHGPGYGVRIPGQGIVSGPFATMEEAQRHAYHQEACIEHEAGGSRWLQAMEA